MSDPAARSCRSTDRQVLVAQANALWHTNSSFKKTPALASVLSARVLPGADGDTEFTSTRLAWERLPRVMQERLKNAVATHSYANSRDQIHPDLANEVERKALPPVRWRHELAQSQRTADARSISRATPMRSTAWTTATPASSWPS